MTGKGKSIKYNFGTTRGPVEISIRGDVGWELENGNDATRGDILTVLTDIQRILIQGCHGQTRFSQIANFAVEMAGIESMRFSQ